MTVLLEAREIALGISSERIDSLSAAYCALTQVNMRPPAMPSSESRCSDPAKSWTIIVGFHNLKLTKIFCSAASAVNQQQMLAPELQK
jgi:hypothetical protein